MSIQKQILCQLMALGNEKADKQLSVFADELRDEILKSPKNNDVIYEKLDLLEEFVYKGSEQTIEIFKYILQTSFPVLKSRSKFGVLEGKSRTDIVLKGLSLLSKIRYILPKKVLPLLEVVITNEEELIKEKALEVLKKLTKYDYAVLFNSKIGYSVQRIVLDYILKWPMKKRLTNLDFIFAVVKELLNSSVEGSSWSDEKTLTMNFAQVDPTNFLKKIRRETIDFVYDLYTRTSDLKVRLRLSSALEEAFRSPGNVKYSDSLRGMLDDDAKYLSNIYRKMIFDKSGNIIRENIAVVEEIEERFYYLAKPDRGRPSDLVELREDILKDSFYEKVRPMIGGRAAYRGEEGYEESKQRREKDQRDLIAKISDEGLLEWTEVLNILAKQKDVIEEWKLGDFKRFLEMLSSETSEVADGLLGDAFKRDKPLINFAESFLIGFQVTQKSDLWDKYSELIIRKQAIYLMGGICNSLVAHAQEQVPRKLRFNELNILEEIVFKKKRFSFLKSKRKDASLWYLHDRLFHALAFNFKPQKRKIEWLIREEIQNNAEYAAIHYQALQFIATVWKWIDLSLASKAFKKYLLNKVVEAPNLDWHLQEFLIELCEKDFDCIMNLFKKRISRTIFLQKKDKSHGIKRLMKRKEFEAIPYHLNPDLQKLLTEDQKRLAATVKSWVLKMTLGWSLYNWEVSRFLESINVDRRQVLSDIVARGDDKDLLRVAYVIEGIGEADFELGMQIIARTDNDKIHKKIGATMYATGVVSGEYGIADAYKGKVEILQKYKESKNRRVKKFVTEMIGYLQSSEMEERKRVAEDSQLRKISFED